MHDSEKIIFSLIMLGYRKSKRYSASLVEMFTLINIVSGYF